MSGKFKRTFVLLIISLLAVLSVQCTPVAESEPRMKATSLTREGKDQVAQSTDEGRGDLTTPTPQAASIQNPSIPAPERTSLPITDASSPGPGQAASGRPMREEEEEIGATEREAPQEADVPTWPVYTHEAYGFSVSYPPYYVVKVLDDAELARLVPVPLAAVYFQDEEVAQSDMAELALPTFSIRVFENKTQQPIEEWLTTTGLLKADQFTEPYQGTHESGINVYSRHLMAPGWFVYVAGDGVIFQLTPMGEEAELMLDTFMISR